MKTTPPMKTTPRINAAHCLRKRNLPFLLMMLGLLAGLAGCKTQRKATALPDEAQYLSAKVALTIPNKGGAITVNGTMKLVSGQCMQLSLLMPILRSEIARMEVQPNEVLVIDRMNKRYVQATDKQLKEILPKRANFEYLEKILFNAAKPDGKRELTGKELGFSSFREAKIVLSDFSDKEITITPTEVSSRYTKVELSKLLEMLAK